MPTPERTRRVIIGGIDTHKDLHVAAVLDAGAVLARRVLPDRPRRLRRPAAVAAGVR